MFTLNEGGGNLSFKDSYKRYLLMMLVCFLVFLLFVVLFYYYDDNSSSKYEYTYPGLWKYSPVSGLAIF